MEQIRPVPLASISVTWSRQTRQKGRRVFVGLWQHDAERANSVNPYMPEKSFHHTAENLLFIVGKFGN